VNVELDHISGVELVRYLLQAGVTIPTVYISAAKTELAHRAAIELGCVAFLEKPFGSAQLIEAVSAAVNSGARLDC
jgi:FixJ family two-component response regulator